MKGISIKSAFTETEYSIIKGISFMDGTVYFSQENNDAQSRGDTVQNVWIRSGQVIFSKLKTLFGHVRVAMCKVGGFNRSEIFVGSGQHRKNMTSG